MQIEASLIVVLGTGGTIAGASSQPGDNVGYTAAQLGAAQLIAAVPALGPGPLEVAQVAQVDSKDMGVAVWRDLALAVDRHLARPEVRAIVVTHGTDTLEETAYFLQRLLAPAKPVVLVAAMRPATSLQADGPQNLVDAFVVARESGARGVVAVLAGRVHIGSEVRKVHPYRLDAFDSGDAGALADVEEGRLRRHRDWPCGTALGVGILPTEPADWPRVEIVTSHAGADGRIVGLLQRDGVEGIVVATTGNGSIHHALEAAAFAAQRSGIAVLRATRTQRGSIVDRAASPALPSAGTLTPVQARVELLLRLLSGRAAEGRAPDRSTARST